MKPIDRLSGIKFLKDHGVEKIYKIDTSKAVQGCKQYVKRLYDSSEVFPSYELHILSLLDSTQADIYHSADCIHGQTAGGADQIRKVYRTASESTLHSRHGAQKSRLILSTMWCTSYD